MVAADLHLSRSFEEISKIIPTKYEVINPTRNLRALVEKIKRGQTLILNGDLVINYSVGYESVEGSNWDLLFKILDKCKGKWYLNLGNHDYRLMPYNYAIYVLKDINVDRALYRQYRKQIGFNKFRGWGELGSMTVNLKRFNTLQRYPFERCYAVNLDGTKLVFLDSGCDAFVKLENYFRLGKIPFMLRHLANSDGLRKEQIKFLANELRNGKAKEVLIFVHAPPFFKVGRLNHEVEVDLEHYDLMLWKEGLVEGVLVNGNAEFMRAVLECDRNVTVITGHNHLCKQYVVSKESCRLKEVGMEEINRLRHDAEEVKFIGLPGLGAIDKKVPGKDKTGYLVINSRQIRYKIMKVYE